MSNSWTDESITRRSADEAAMKTGDVVVNSLKVPPYLNRTFATTLAILVLLIAASVAVIQADAQDSDLDTAQRDDVVQEDGGSVSGGRR